MNKKTATNRPFAFVWMRTSMDDDTLSAGAKHLALAMGVYLDAENKCFPGQERLAKDTNTGNVRSIRRWSKELQSAGYLIVLERGGRSGDGTPRPTRYLAVLPGTFSTGHRSPIEKQSQPDKLNISTGQYRQSQPDTRAPLRAKYKSQEEEKNQEQAFDEGISSRLELGRESQSQPTPSTVPSKDESFVDKRTSAPAQGGPGARQFHRVRVTHGVQRAEFSWPAETASALARDLLSRGVSVEFYSAGTKKTLFPTATRSQGRVVA